MYRRFPLFSRIGVNVSEPDGTLANATFIGGRFDELGGHLPYRAVCAVFDRNGDGSVSVDEIIRAVNAVLLGCG